MRRVLYNLAANYCVSYTQIAVKTPLNVCLERDKGREEGRRVGEEVIKRMEGKMEWPGEEGWEKGSCFFCGEGGDSIEVLLGVIEKGFVFCYYCFVVAVGRLVVLFHFFLILFSTK